ncbi:Mitochondrial-processing peptidase subunit beta [Tilletia horrida]|nr:Mitochondrial-processing peptidase subunit beta [Tilletia horrida]
MSASAAATTALRALRRTAAAAAATTTRTAASSSSSSAAAASSSARTLATAAAASSTPRFTATQVSTLPNGLTVATQSNPAAQTATVGTWIDAGSRAESDQTSGTAHFLEHLAFKGTNKRSQHALELEVENLGAHLNAYTSREHTVFYAKAFRADVDKAVDIIADILQNSKLEPSAIERERDVILREQEEVDKQLEEVVFDHLHAVAFQGQALGRTILGPKKNILSIKRDDLESYIKSNYTADRMVLVGAGGIEHDALVDLAKKHFTNLPTSSTPLGGSASLAPTKFVGAEVRIRDDTMPTCNLAIAVEGVSWKSPDYFTMLVLQSILGNWDRSLGSSPLLSSRLSHIISANNLANSFMHFSTSYSDTGLWGIYAVSENVTNLDDLVHFTLKEWQRMSTAPTEGEVGRAKAQLRASLLLGLDGTTAVAEDIGRQLVTAGKRFSPEQIEAEIEKVDVKAVQAAAQKYLWDADIAIAAVGRVEGLLDYNRIRADMSSMSW